MERYERPVYYYETDKMAIVHNANYLRIFEEARLDFMRKSGIPYTQIEESGILIPQVEAHVRYHQPLSYGDIFCVKVTLTQFSGIVMSYQYEIRRKADEALIAEGRTMHCFVDEANRFPLNLKKRLPQAYEIMTAQVSKAESSH